MTTRTFFLRTTNATLRSESTALWVLSTALSYPVGSTLEFQLRRLEVFNVFSVIGPLNNTLVTSGVSYTLPEGSPSASALAAQISLITGLSCTFDQSSLRFSLSSEIPFIILETSTCLGLLGFTGPRLTPALSHTSDTLCNLAPPYAIDVSTNFVLGNSTGEQVGTTRLASVPVTGSYGDLIQWFETSPDAWSTTYTDTSLTYLRVALTDARSGNPLNLQGTDWGVVLLLREVPPVGGPRNNYEQESAAFYDGDRASWQSSQRVSREQLSVKGSAAPAASSAREREAQARSSAR